MALVHVSRHLAMCSISTGSLWLTLLCAVNMSPPAVIQRVSTCVAMVTCPTLGKPMIDAPVAGEVVKEGDMVTLKCSAHGYPTPQFTWKPSGQEVRM